MTDTLNAILRQAGPAAIAVSGGIDSLTLARLATLAHSQTVLYHAVSAAVPAQATQRVRELSDQFGWTLKVVDAGEMRDPDYLSNPVNRCFHCKNNLYGAILSATNLPVFSGANLDDLQDYRPGLQSAAEHGVRHPFIEAEIDKPLVRQLAKDHGLDGFCEIPASPCLSSRVLTGLRIDPDELMTIDRVEAALRRVLGDIPLRCRRVMAGFMVQVDAAILAGLAEHDRQEVLAISSKVAGQNGKIVGIEPYKMGSAFAHRAPHA